MIITLHETACADTLPDTIYKKRDCRKRCITASTKGFYCGCALKMTRRLRGNGIAINVLIADAIR